jgi:hypothetical protein
MSQKQLKHKGEPIGEKGGFVCGKTCKRLTEMKVDVGEKHDVRICYRNMVKILKNFLGTFYFTD